MVSKTVVHCKLHTAPCFRRVLAAGCEVALRFYTGSEKVLSCSQEAGGVSVCTLERHEGRDEEAGS